MERNRVLTLVGELLTALGDDPQRPALLDTPERVADLYAELYRGVGVDLRALLDNAEPLDSAESERGKLVALKGIDFTSICEHHLLPFTGTCDVVYRPGSRLVGLGVLADLVHLAAARPQIQERLGEMVCDALVSSGVADGALIVIRAEHGCVAHRGPKLQGSQTITVAARGVLGEDPQYSQALALVGGAE